MWPPPWLHQRRRILLKYQPLTAFLVLLYSHLPAQVASAIRCHCPEHPTVEAHVRHISRRGIAQDNPDYRPVILYAYDV